MQIATNRSHCCRLQRPTTYLGRLQGKPIHDILANWGHNTRFLQESRDHYDEPPSKYYDPQDISLYNPVTGTW